MKSEWKEYKISEFADVIGGGTPSTKIEEYYNGTIPWLTPRDMSTHSSKYICEGARSITSLGLKKSSARLVPKGTVLFTSRAPIGYIAIAKQEVSTNQGFKSLICNDKIAHNEYIYYLLKSKVFAIESIASGSTFKEVSGSVLKDFILQLPSIPTQKRIAHILSALDDKIELNRKMNQTLESMAQTLFKSWFVDFDPVKVKAKCKNDEELESAALELGISKEVLELFPSEFEESELGMIPKGWEIKNLGDICSIITKGTTPTKSNLVNAIDDQIIPFIKVKDIGNNGEINRDSLEKIPYSVHMKVLKRSILERDDLLFSIAGTIGRVAIVDNDLNNSNVNQALGIIRLNDKLQHLNLVWLSLQSDRTQKNIISKVVQGVQANTSLANLRDIPIIIPSLELLTKWNNVIGDLMVNFRLNQFSSRTLQKTRDTLLPKLLSGELDVSDLDIENEG